MKVLLIGPGDHKSAISMIREKIKDVDIEIAEVMPPEKKLEKIDLVINDPGELPDLLKDNVMVLQAPADYYPTAREMKKFKEPKTYRSKKDRRNHR